MLVGNTDESELPRLPRVPWSWWQRPLWLGQSCVETHTVCSRIRLLSGTSVVLRETDAQHRPATKTKVNIRSYIAQSSPWDWILHCGKETK